LNLRRFIAVLACLLAAVGLQAATAAADPAPDLPTGPILQPGDPNWPSDPSFQNDGEWPLWGQMPGNCTGTTPNPGGGGTSPRPGGGLPCWAPQAVDPEGASGINVTGAWAQDNVGRDDILLAYIEGGVNYSSNSIRDVLNNIFLNRGELPYPQGRNGSDLGRYDFDGNGRFDIRDYIQDPRVNPECGPGDTDPGADGSSKEGTIRTCFTGGQHQYLHQVTIENAKRPYLSPDDLVAVFGKCRITDNRTDGCPADGRFDNDGNGYPNDISGWNAYHNTNDPQTENLDYDHASGLMTDMAGVRNNGFSGVGICPECRVIPVKSGAESVGKADGLAPAITYAVDIGADAVSSVVVSYAYSSALREAVAYAVRKNVLMSMDSNDFDSMDHTDGHLFDDVFPGNGLVQAKDGSGKIQTFRGRGTVTSYGTHSIFSGNSATTSGATPFQAAFLAMVQSAARNAVDAGKYPRDLTPNEVRQVLINTVSPIVPETDYPQVPRQWPGNPDSKTDATHTNWSTQYGYGRPNIGKATRLVMDGLVPPTARLTSPSWYQYVDPSRQKKLQVKGSVQPSAWGSDGVAWTLEWAFGADPKDSAFRTISTGKSGKSGVLGTINLKQMAKYARKNPGSTLPLTSPGPEQYTISVRLRARDGNGLKGEDRRSFGTRTDTGMVPGYPKAIGTEMSTAPTFADLQGRGQQDLVFGTYDGVINAIGPDGRQAKNFPLKTRELRNVGPEMPQNFDSEAYSSVRALREARDPVSGIAIGDLKGKGDTSVVATTFSGWTYAWSATTGKLRPGFPAKPDPAYDTLPSPTPSAVEPGKPESPGSRLPTRGNWSAPVLANLTGDGKLSILVSSFDGHLYAFRPNGKAVPGWPVEMKLPASKANAIPAGQYIRDPKLIQPPAVGDVLGTGTDQVFLPSFECDKSNNSVYVYGIQSDGNNHAGGPFMPGWPVAANAMAGCYQESIDFVQEGGNGVTMAEIDGQARISFTPAGGFPLMLDSDGSVYRNLLPGCKTAPCKGISPYYLEDGLVIGLTGQSAFGDMKGDGKPVFAQSVAGATSLMQAFEARGTALLAHVYDSVWDPVTGQQLPAFPTDQDGFAFYSSPVITGLGTGKTRSMISSNDSYWIHARGPDGMEAPGFPKWTGQWTGFGGAVGDPKLNGKQVLAYGTREGQLFLWNVGGRAESNDQWWKYRHDEHNSGRYGNDTRPPAGVKVKVKRTGESATLTWKAAGDNGVSNGKVKTIQVYTSNKAISAGNLAKAKKLRAPEPARPGKSQSVKVKIAKKKTAWVAIRSRDGAGNWSQLTRVKVGRYNPKPAIRKCRKQFRKDAGKRKKCIRKAKRG